MSKYITYTIRVVGSFDQHAIALRVDFFITFAYYGEYKNVFLFLFLYLVNVRE